MAQQVQRGYEITPLDQLAQRATTEGVFCYFEARLLGQQTQVHQDLMEGKATLVTHLGQNLLFLRLPQITVSPSVDYCGMI